MCETSYFVLAFPGAGADEADLFHILALINITTPRPVQELKVINIPSLNGSRFYRGATITQNISH